MQELGNRKLQSALCHVRKLMSRGGIPQPQCYLARRVPPQVNAKLHELLLFIQKQLNQLFLQVA
jgi:hypothetical protein